MSKLLLFPWLHRNANQKDSPGDEKFFLFILPPVSPRLLRCSPLHYTIFHPRGDEGRDPPAVSLHSSYSWQSKHHMSASQTERGTVLSVIVCWFPLVGHSHSPLIVIEAGHWLSCWECSGNSWSSFLPSQALKETFKAPLSDTETRLLSSDHRVMLLGQEYTAWHWFGQTVGLFVIVLSHCLGSSNYSISWICL